MTMAVRVRACGSGSDISSTDANLPMSLGIPAITMSRIAKAGGAHSPGEWIDVEKAPNVKLRRILLATILAAADAR